MDPLNMLTNNLKNNIKKSDLSLASLSINKSSSTQSNETVGTVEFVELLLKELQGSTGEEESTSFLGTTASDSDPFSKMMTMNQSYVLGQILRSLNESKSYNPTQSNPVVQTQSQTAQVKSIVGGTSNNSNDLGLVSAKYESSGNPGVISNTPGDPGGKSYGAWQFNTRDGIVGNFYRWTKNHDPVTYSKLNEAYKADGSTNGSNFDAAWKKVAKDDSKGFWQLQHDFTKERYYDAAAKRLLNETGFDINKQSFALQNVLWSTSVQHGVGGAMGIFKDVNLGGSQKEIITDIYKERQNVDVHFRSCSQEVKNSVFNRFGREMNDALQLL